LFPLTSSYQPQNIRRKFDNETHQYVFLLLFFSADVYDLFITQMQWCHFHLQPPIRAFVLEDYPGRDHVHDQRTTWSQEPEKKEEAKLEAWAQKGDGKDE
jgi:hypothetical protein